MMEAMEVSQAYDINALRRENEELKRALEEAHKMLHESTTMRQHAEAQLDDMEEKCQDLAGRLELAKKSEDWTRKEFDVLTAQMEIVHLIFGGRQGGGCGGCH